MTSNIEELLGHTCGPLESLSLSIITDLKTAIESSGYSPLLQEVQNHAEEAIYSKLIEILGNGDVNVIPSVGGGVCCSRLVAFSKGLQATPNGNGDVVIEGLQETLQHVKAHLIRCSPGLDGSLPNQCSTRTVIVLLDAWDGSSFLDNHREEFVAFHKKGVNIIFLQVGSDGHSINWIEQDLAT